MNKKNLFRMSIRFAFTLLLPTALLLSCKHVDPDVVIIDDDDAVEVNFEDVATNVRVMPIISDTVLGSCAKILSYANETFMLEKTGSSIYYIVDGFHVSTLSAKGQGPGEYLSASTFEYSPANKMLYVFSLLDKKILWYSVPDMRYCGFTRLTGWVSNISMHDDNNFFVVKSNEASDSTWIQLIDIKSGVVVDTIEQIGGFAYGENDMVSYRPSNRIYTISGNVNNLGTINKKNEFEILLRYGFGEKSFPADMIDFEINENDKFMAILNYLGTPAGESVLCGNFFPRMKKNAFSFWYHRALTPFTQLNYCRIKGNHVDNMKGFKVSGINRQIVPKGITDDGYIYVFEGYADSYLDSAVELSPLAKQIIDAMNSQKDNNQVLLFFDIK